MFRNATSSARAPSVLVTMRDASGYIRRTSADQIERARSGRLLRDNTARGALRSPITTGMPARRAAAIDTMFGPMRKLTSRSSRSRLTTRASCTTREASRPTPVGARPDRTTIGTSRGGA
jgi:hypothetical protein